MTYEPQVNDYVKWKKHISGWVYFKCGEYVTIEVAVRPKSAGCPFHKNYHILVLCYNNQWKELKYIRSRKTTIDTSSDTSSRTDYPTVESKTSSD